MSKPEFTQHTQLRLRWPDATRRSIAIEAKEPGGKWKVFKLAELDAINDSLKAGVLTLEQASARAEIILKLQYEERDKLKPIVPLVPGNVALARAFIEHAYPPIKKNRMAPRSYESQSGSILLAVRAVGGTPIDGDAATLQNIIDQEFGDDPGTHAKRITAINRVRLWKQLPPLVHLPRTQHDVLYITEAQLPALLAGIEHRWTKIMTGALFYSGLRIGELFALRPQDVIETTHGMIITVSRQMLIDGEYGPPKNRRSRKAFVIPGGEQWLIAWLALPREELMGQRGGKHNERIKKAAKGQLEIDGFYLHCLRHSYCVHLISRGCSLDWTAQSAGHSRDVCARYYSSHVLADDSIRLISATLRSSAALQRPQLVTEHHQEAGKVADVVGDERPVAADGNIRQAQELPSQPHKKKAPG